MKNQEIVDVYYKESVKNLNRVIQLNKNLWYDAVLQLPLHLQVVYTTITTHQQIYKSGFRDYFHSMYAQFALMTLDNFLLIDAIKSFRILGEAVHAFENQPVDVDTVAISDSTDKRAIKTIVVDVFDELDTEYYALEEDIEYLLVNYLKKNILIHQNVHLVEHYR